MLEHKNIFIQENDNKEFIDFCLRAKKQERYITVVYNKGYADYSGIFQELDNEEFERTFKIGKSTGAKPILLEINSEYSDGGGSLFAHNEAIKSWKYSTGVEEEINDNLGTSLYQLINNSYEKDEDGCYSINHEKLKLKIEQAISVLS